MSEVSVCSFAAKGERKSIMARLPLSASLLGRWVIMGSRDFGSTGQTGAAQTSVKVTLFMFVAQDILLDPFMADTWFFLF